MGYKKRAFFLIILMGWLAFGDRKPPLHPRCELSLRLLKTVGTDALVGSLLQLSDIESPGSSRDDLKNLVNSRVLALSRASHTSNGAVREAVAELVRQYIERYRDPFMCRPACPVLLPVIQGSVHLGEIHQAIRLLRKGPDSEIFLYFDGLSQRLDPELTAVTFYPATDDERAEAVASMRLLETLGVRAVAAFEGLLNNGGARLERQRLVHTGKHRQDSSERFEIAAASKFSWEQEEFFLGLGDQHVLNVLDPAFEKRQLGFLPQCPDWLSVKRGPTNQAAWRIREVKSGHITGATVKKAVNQLASGIRMLRAWPVRSPIDRVEIVVPKGNLPQAEEGLFGEALAEDPSRFPILYYGKPLSLEIRGEKFPVTLLAIDVPVE